MAVQDYMNCVSLDMFQYLPHKRVTFHLATLQSIFIFTMPDDF